jgi:hypothetical protein
MLPSSQYMHAYILRTLNYVTWNIYTCGNWIEYNNVIAGAATKRYWMSWWSFCAETYYYVEASSIIVQNILLIDEKVVFIYIESELYIIIPLPVVIDWWIILYQWKLLDIFNLAETFNILMGEQRRPTITFMVILYLAKILLHSYKSKPVHVLNMNVQFVILNICIKCFKRRRWHTHSCW